MTAWPATTEYAGSSAHLTELLAAIAAGQEAGELRDDVDAGTAAWMVERVLLGLPQRIMARFGIDPERVAADGSAMDRPEVASMVDDVVALLVAALSPERS